MEKRETRRTKSDEVGWKSRSRAKAEEVKLGVQSTWTEILNERKVDDDCNDWIDMLRIQGLAL